MVAAERQFFYTFISTVSVTFWSGYTKHTLILNCYIVREKTYFGSVLGYCCRMLDAGAAIAVRATSATLCNFGHPMQHGLFFVVFDTYSNDYFYAQECLRKVRNCWKAERTTIRHLNEQFVPDTNLPQTSLHLPLLPSSI